MTSKYIIVTPAFNEESYISQAIESVLEQIARPIRWIIVDDGSTDNTAAIVKRYLLEYPWIQYLFRSREPGQSYYGSNVLAIAEGLIHVQEIEYDYLAILDADISLPRDYYELILRRIESDTKLGIASGVYLDNVNGRLQKVLHDSRSTPKALMVVRRKCYEDIGGFVPMKYGGEDTCACFMARMRGWKVWSFPDVVAIHNKPVGTGHSGRLLEIRFRQGVAEYLLATQPLFLLVKSLRRCVKERPLLLAGFARIAGFLYGNFKRERRQISDDMVRFIRKEQMKRLFSFNKIPKEQQVTVCKGEKRMKICLAASAGGHLTQLLRVKDACQGHEVFCVSSSAVVRNELDLLGRTYTVNECNRRHPVKCLRVLFQCLKISARERPSVVISTGAAPGILMCLTARLFGAKIVWLDSIANTERLSVSGRIVRPFADLVLSQWPDVAAKYEDVVYAGAVI